MIHRLNDKVITSGKHAPIKFHSNYNTQRGQYIQSQGPTSMAPRDGHGRSRIQTKALSHPLEVTQLSPRELQSRLNETNSAHAASFVQQRAKSESATFDVIKQYNDTVQHFLINGHKWPRRDSNTLARHLHAMTSFVKFTDWFLTTNILKEYPDRSKEYG